MRVLVIAPKIPWPLDQGDKVHMFNVMKEISKEHSITFIGCYLRNYQLLEEARNQLKSLCTEVVFFRIPNHNLLLRIYFKIQAIINLILFSKRWSEYIYNLRPFIQLVKQHVDSDKYDVIIKNYWYTAYKALINSRIPIICDTHDVMWEHDFRSNQKYRNNSIKYWFRKRINEKLRWKEASILNSCNLIVAISEKDVQTFKNQLNITKPIVVLTTINGNRFKYKFNKIRDNCILIYGAMQSEMNKDAVKYLVLELFPEIRKRISGVKLLIAGSSISATIESFENIEDVTVSGYVPDLGILFQSAKVLILPLRSGSGVKGRILEAMESGLPVVCTTMAAEGLSVINGVHMIIEDTNERIIEGVVTLLNDDQKREKIALNARRYFDENYSWEKTYGRIHEILGSAIQRK